MATIILLDVSLSLARIVPGLDISHMNLVGEGVHFLISLFQQFQPMEQVSLMSFHSQTELLQPFTSNYGLLYTALGNANLGDKTDLKQALAAASHQFTSRIEKYPKEKKTIVIVTDGRPCEAISLVELKFAFPISIHVVALGSTFDFEQSFYKDLTKRFRGSFYPLTTTEINVEDVKKTFHSLLTTNYPIYQSKLSCGWLGGWITLHPNPTGQNTGQCMDIIGFLPSTVIPCIPASSSHCLIPLSLFTSGTAEANIADESLYLCLILHDTLKEKNMMAVVQLIGGRYALVTVVQKNDSSSCLILHFLPSDVNIPWLGKMEDLKLTKKQIPLQHDSWEAYPASYYTKKSTNVNIQPIPSISEDALQTECQRIVRLVKQLPAKQDPLLEELQRIKVNASQFKLSSLLESICDLLSNIRGQVRDIEISQILTHYITQLQETDFNSPLERYVKPAPLRGMSVNDLLN